MEKKNREELSKEVEEFARRWQKLLEDDGEKRMSALYEQLQVRLEAINSDLQVSEEELQKFHAVITVFDLHSKDSKDESEEDGKKI